MAEDWEAGGFGIYIHWPFCEAKCPYCDFNSHVSRSIDHARWASAYLSELDRHAAMVPGRVVRSIFFGGGTPSLMAPETVDAILTRIRALWPQANDVEITLEANPGSVESGRFRAYSEAGVNRLSMGVQALNDVDLKRLGRLHTAAEALAAFDIAKTHIERVSFDLIYGRQHQTAADWKNELSQALTLAVDHLSLYQLTIEDGTAFGDRYHLGKLRGLPDEDSAASMYEMTQDLTSAAGFACYEISNHCRPGAESRHNRLYWRYGDYVGIGPGAHGRLTIKNRRHATEAARMPDKWMRAAETGNGTIHTTPLTREEEAAEFLLMGLRLTEGVHMARFEALADRSFSKDTLDELAGLDLITIQDGRLAATPRGRLVLNAVIEKVLPT